MEDYLFPCQEDDNNEVVFDQPYFYPKIPEGGKYDELDFYNFPNGAFITSDGYFFNNLGYDRYGGRLDAEGEYYKVDSREIKNKEAVEAPPHYEHVEEKGEYQEADHAFKGIDDGYVGEEDFGDDQIFGRKGGAPKYYKKKGDPAGAPIYPKRSTQIHTKEETKVQVKSQAKIKERESKVIKIGSASKSQINKAININQRSQKPGQGQKQTQKQLPRESEKPIPEKTTVVQGQAEIQSKTEVTSQLKESSKPKKKQVAKEQIKKEDQEKKQVKTSEKETRKDSKVIEQQAQVATQQAESYYPSEKKDYYQEGSGYYQAERGYYQRGRGYNKRGRDFYQGERGFAQRERGYQRGGRGYQKGYGRGYYEQETRPGYTGKEVEKKPTTVKGKAKVQAKVVTVEAKSDSAWDF